MSHEGRKKEKEKRKSNFQRPSSPEIAVASCAGNFPPASKIHAPRSIYTEIDFVARVSHPLYEYTRFSIGCAFDLYVYWGI